jgi:cation diffusion facilitator family transporter
VTPQHQQAKSRAAALSIISNAVLIVLKLTVGIMIQSVSVISEAVHSGLDLVAAVIAWFAVRESGKPADEDHPFGHGKIENVAGTIEAVLIFGAAIYIICKAVMKLHEGKLDIESLGLGAGVMAVSAIANFLVSNHLMKVARETDSVALEADALHLRTDVYTSAGVLGGLVAIKLTGLAILDPIVAIVVALLIIKAAWDLTRSAFLHILDVSLPEDEAQVIHDVMAEFTGRYREYHKVRTRKSGHIRHIDMHLVVPGGTAVDAAHRLSHEIADRIGDRLAHSHTLVHIEPCQGVCPECEKRCAVYPVV